MFRDRKIALGNWKPAERPVFDSKEARILGGWNKGKSMPVHWKAITGVNIQTGEIVKFRHAGEAVKN